MLTDRAGWRLGALWIALFVAACGASDERAGDSSGGSAGNGVAGESAGGQGGTAGTTSTGGAGGDAGGGGGLAGAGGSGAAGAAGGGGFAANAPPYTPIVPGAACFGCDWDVENLPDFHFYHVETLGTGTGAGTYRAAVSGSWSGCRVVVFDVSGTIQYPEGTQIDTTTNCLIEAGQTAPSPGIFISGAKRRIRASKYLAWHMVFAQRKLTDTNQAMTGDVMIISGTPNPVRDVLLLNSSFMWGQDEIVDTYMTSTHVSIYQSLVTWPLNCANHPKGCHGFGTLYDDSSYPIDSIRTIYANSVGRNPRFMSSGSMLNNVVYNHTQRGFETANGIDFNIEGNVFIAGPKGTGTSTIFIQDTTPAAARIFYLNGNNRGMNGLADPPKPTNKASPDILEMAKQRIESSYPAGYVTQDPGSTNDEEAEFVELVTACNGARPLDRIPLLQHAYDDVLSFGKQGKVIDSPSEVGGVPSLAENTTDHADIPPNPNAPGKHINAAMDWLVEKSQALLPPGKGCN